MTNYRERREAGHYEPTSAQALEPDETPLVDDDDEDYRGKAEPQEEDDE